MPKGLSFAESHRLGAELGNYPPFSIREATRIGDNRRVIVKIYCKLGQSLAEQEKVQNEIQFWRLISQPRIVEIADIYDDEGFLYIVYEFPEGGDLAALVMDSTRTFTEGFARKVASALLNALIFLHSNGIIHGGVLPTNIIFSSPTSVPGWPDSCKLTFFRIDTTRMATIFTDIQDLAYSIVSIMRKRAGLLSRTYFTPEILQSSDWNHLTNDFIDFIDQLWNAKERYKSAETFLDHQWLLGNSRREGNSLLASLPTSSTKPSEEPTSTLQSHCYIKMREKSTVGTRRWKRKWSVLRGGTILFYRSIDEDQIENQHLAKSIELRDKQAIVFAASTHNFTFALQDINLQQIVLWLRYDTEEDFQKWKDCITSFRMKEEAKNKPKPASTVASLSPPSSNFAPQLADALTSGSEINSKLLVSAVDKAAKEFGKQIEAQANSYLRKSEMLQLLRGNKLGNLRTSHSFNHSLSPFPSEQKTRIHPSVKWDMRAQELMLVMSTGTPVNLPVQPGQQWFIIDATWFRHWIAFVSSSRRMAPPGPIDNLWMINPHTDSPYELMKEDVDGVPGDFRRVPPQIWELFEIWYGGGPAISCVGPPLEDTRRWTIHVYERAEDERDGENIIELVSKLEHPEDIIQKESKDGKDSRMAVKLRQGRKASMAELTLLAKTADFHDGEEDKAERGLSAVDSDEEAEENDSEDEQDEKEDSFGKLSSQGSFVERSSFPPLTAAQLQLLAEQDDGEQSHNTIERKDDVLPPTQKKRASIFERITH